MKDHDRLVAQKVNTDMEGWVPEKEGSIVSCHSNKVLCQVNNNC